MKRELRYILMKDCLKRHYGDEYKNRIQLCLEELEEIVGKKYQAEIVLEESFKLLNEFELSIYIINGLNRKGIETIAELKEFIICDQLFRKSGVLSISGLGSGATRELLDKIPMLKEFCESLDIKL